MWIFFLLDILVCRKLIHQKTKSEKQNYDCFLLDLKAMYRIPVWQGNLLANAAHACNGMDVAVQSSSLDVQKFSKYSIPEQLL
jgi:hypothetical protein